MITYTNYTNIDAAFCRPYEPGDRLVCGYQGEMMGFENLTPIVVIAESLYRLHNLDCRPDGQLCPSMSVGDVIVIGEVALSVDNIGFKVVQLDPADLITDRSWKELARS